MCQAIPRRVLRVAPGRAEVDYDGTPTWVPTPTLPEVAVGDYLVVYAGQALEKMDEDEAVAMLDFYANLESMLEEASR